MFQQRVKVPLKLPKLVIDLFEIDYKTKYDDCVVVYEKRKQLKRLSKDLLVVLLHFTQDCESETRTSGMKILQ